MFTAMDYLSESNFKQIFQLYCLEIKGYALENGNSKYSVCDF